MKEYKVETINFRAMTYEDLLRMRKILIGIATDPREASRERIDAIRLMSQLATDWNHTAEKGSSREAWREQLERQWSEGT